MRIGRWDVRPLGGAPGCVLMVAVSIALSIALTVLLNLIFR